VAVVQRVERAIDHRHFLAVLVKLSVSNNHQLCLVFFSHEGTNEIEDREERIESFCLLRALRSSSWFSFRRVRSHGTYRSRDPVDTSHTAV
jgi:hypothetical protein